jgi:hypothetical protein
MRFELDFGTAEWQVLRRLGLSDFQWNGWRLSAMLDQRSPITLVVATKGFA